MTRPTKAALSAEVERLRADYDAACRELARCREALRRERLARWGIVRRDDGIGPLPGAPHGAPV